MITEQGRHVSTSGQRIRVLSGLGDLLRSLLTSLVTTALVVAAIAFLAGAYAIVVLHVAGQTVLTGSMRGTFDPGALVLSVPIPVSQVKPGDVIVFTPPGHSTPYTHRVVTVSTNKAGQRVVTTKGDANPAPDSWKAVLEGSTVPRVFAHVPYAGRAFLAVRDRTTHTTLLVLLGLVAAVAGTRLLLGSSRQRHLSAQPSSRPTKELMPCPSTPHQPRPAVSTAHVPSPRQPSESEPSRSPERVSTPV